MGYEYDSKVNRDLARTAMSIYTKSQGIKPQEINESKQNLNEEVIRENVNGLIMNYISDVIILAEAEMGREMTDIEISEASDELLRRIDSISDEEKTPVVSVVEESEKQWPIIISLLTIIPLGIRLVQVQEKLPPIPLVEVVLPLQERSNVPRTELVVV